MVLSCDIVAKRGPVFLESRYDSGDILGGYFFLAQVIERIMKELFADPQRLIFRSRLIH